VHDGAAFLAHHLNTPLQHVVKVRRSVKQVGFQPDWLHSSNRVTVNLKAILREVDVPQLAGLQDPASVAWELLPWSFVVDWFIPIGNWLECRGLASSLTGTFVISTKNIGECRHFKKGGSYPMESPMEYRKILTFDREISTSLSVPVPSLKPLGKALSWRHCENAVALLVGIVR